MTDGSFLKTGTILVAVATIGIVTALLWSLTTVETRPSKPVPLETAPTTTPDSHAGKPDSTTPKAATPEPVSRKSTVPGSAVNVILVVVDTERSDVTTPYGAKLPTTPFLARLAREGVVFKKAYSTAPWTVPAMYSMITGLNPREHGILSGTVEILKNGGLEIHRQHVLPDQAVTLAEVLKRDGYSTFGVCTNLHLTKRFGFAQGFDHFVGETFSFLPYPNEALASLLPIIQSQSKYFLWMHYFDPHLPYHTDNVPWFHQWNESDVHSYASIAFDLVKRDYLNKKGLSDDAPIAPADLKAVFSEWQSTISKVFTVPDIWFEKFKPGLTKEHKAFFRKAYLGNIRQTDEAMREALTSLAIDDQSLVIVTSDHGEELFERGRVGHHHAPRWSLYQELLHVPLIILLPGRKHAGTVVTDPVSILDIFPTILDVLGIEGEGPVSGKSLLSYLEGAGDKNRSLFAEVSHQRSGGRALIEYPWKYIYNSRSKEGALYNLEKDPGERLNIASKAPERAAQMREKIADYVQNAKPRWPIEDNLELSAEDVQQMKNLGYMN